MKIIVYGSSWCGWTRRAVAHLDDLEVEYDYIEVDRDPEAEKLIGSWNEEQPGRAIRPTIAIGDDHWINPTFDELDAELQSRGLLPA